VIAPGTAVDGLSGAIGRVASARPVAALCVMAATVLLTTPLLRPPVRAPGPVGGGAFTSARLRRTVVRRPLGRIRSSSVVRPRTARPVPPDVVAAWCDDIGRACRGGSALGTAIIRSSPADRRLRRVVEDVALGLGRGRSLEDALAGTRTPTDRHTDLAIVVLSTVARAGGSAARPLERLAATLRLRSADGLDRAAQGAQARLSAKVLMAVPVAALALLLTVDPAVRGTVASPLGAVIVAGGAALAAVGWWWMTTIIDREAS